MTNLSNTPSLIEHEDYAILHIKEVGKSVVQDIKKVAVVKEEEQKDDFIERNSKKYKV